MTSRVRRSFWTLVVVTVAATGALSRALAAEPGPATGLAAAGSAVLLAASASVALRILVVSSRQSTGRERSGGSG